ncbi:ABC transporter ATP-binding protein [Pseudoroseicyclus aestuarii]|uniref:Peptide/nickel transport system ATP-binding protein/oligopeptide transport system ATP-binding protein n=1 Tax=Pseudoroseicyclus aestuarii TaxID=1795041 RepID=A0A318T3M3_9RHOB|nr:ABC transporter ATP-binding protein [Pseudoroseicyclus aestuarii]PYE80901.1 peptide/nickel transport system ATP-binding protein/oligopeptide transport system ATP-binding protein [Pseudoroseicyclus aestuarii]
MSDTPLLKVEDLSVRFHTRHGAAHVVNGISYDVAPGEILGIVGESGSGKSVHTLAIAGLLPGPRAEVTQGRVLFRGQDLLALTPDERRRLRGREIGMVFQDCMTSLNPVMTVGAQISEALVLRMGLGRRAARRRAAEILDAVGVSEPVRRLDDYPHQLSGGMLQRVGIAMGICCEPKLLIADEPTTALDVTVQAQILALIYRLCREMGMTVLLITHDLGVVARTAHRTAVMYAGQLMEIGPTASVFTDTRSAYTLGLLRSQPVPGAGRRQRLAQLPGSPPDLRALPSGDPFAPRNPFATTRDAAERPPLRPVPGGDPRHFVAAWYDLPQAFAAQIAATGGPVHPTDLRQRYYPQGAA